MLNKLMISTAAIALLTGSAMAQQTGTPPAQKAPMQKETTTTTMPAPKSSAKFIHEQGADKWVFSKFKGTDVLGPQDEHIGDVEDVVFSKDGKIEGVVVGVGGFLGIGSKNVAIDMSAFQVVPASTGSAAGGTSSNNDPNNIKLKVTWTKDELKNAPDFQYYKAPSNSASSSSKSPTTGMGPASPPPPRR
jgi:hypothetical protein